MSNPVNASAHAEASEQPQPTTKNSLASDKSVVVAAQVKVLKLLAGIVADELKKSAVNQQLEIRAQRTRRLL